jgi:hypothetical protein
MSTINVSLKRGNAIRRRHVSAVASRSFSLPSVRYRTNGVERLLLFIIPIAVPLQEWLPTVSGFSTLSLLFAFTLGYVVINNLQFLAITWNHPLFLVSYALVVSGALIETLHPYSEYAELGRIAQMILGAICIASLCRDRAALRSLVYGLIIAGLWVSIFLFLNYYGTLTQHSANDFLSASQVRSNVFESNPLGENLNTIAFVTAQGGVISLALALKSASWVKRVVLSGISTLCFAATFIPMSRGGIVVAAAGMVIVLIRHKADRGRAVMAVMVLSLGLAFFAPPVSISRLHYSADTAGGKVEARTRVFNAAMQELPNYVLTGVGVGNFWGAWGLASGFRHDAFRVSGAHNVFLQITIYWGVVGTFLLLVLIWLSFRCLPAYRSFDQLDLPVLGITVSVLLLSFVVHNLYAKEFSIGLGVLVASSVWIWPAHPNQRRAFRFK